MRTLLKRKCSRLIPRPTWWNLACGACQRLAVFLPNDLFLRDYRDLAEISSRRPMDVLRGSTSFFPNTWVNIRVSSGQGFLWCSLVFTVVMSTASCNEQLLEKPDNLIPQEKMVEVLRDLAVINAAKSNNAALLEENGIEPMAYVFEKHDIDSLQFVESDRYYASLPKTYEVIYKQVESRLETEGKALEEAKKINDSLNRVELDEGKVGENKVEEEQDKKP